jgi:hypothetical protein
LTLIPAKINQDPLTQHHGESFGPNRIAWRISLGCSDSIASPRTGVEAILTELGPENQNWRYAVSSHTVSDGSPSRMRGIEMGEEHSDPNANADAAKIEEDFFTVASIV